MEEIPGKHLFRFGVFEADQLTGELRKQGRRMQLQGQPFDILVMLLERPGELVSRTQIRERLWPDGTFVDFDHSLNTAVNKIRDVLGDSAASPRFVETIARRGYRFIALVQLDGGPATSHSAEPSPENSSSFLTAPHEVPHAKRNVVSIFFLLLQLMYLCFY